MQKKLFHYFSQSYLVNKKKHEHSLLGFTIIEMVIVVAVMVILAALALYGFSSFHASGDLLRASDMAVGALKDARSRTLSSQNNNQYGIFLDQNQNRLILFPGPYYNAGASQNEETKLPSQIEISGLSLTNGTTSIAFARLSGDPTATGTITLRVKGAASSTKIIQINDSGIIKVQ